jgi:hypothetical protein
LRSYLESTHYKKKKKVGRVVQVVDHLPSKREALNSNPQKKKKFTKLPRGKNLQMIRYQMVLDFSVTTLEVRK